MTTVLIVDDYPAFLDVARSMLDGQGFRVVGVALDGESALAQVTVLKPDVVLLDVQLPDIDGFEVARRIMDMPVRPVVVLTSTRDAEDYGARLEEAAALGFIGKSELSGARLTAVVSAGS